MIEIDKRPNYPDETHDLIINGVVSDYDSVHVYRNRKGHCEIWLYDPHVADQILSHNVLSLPPIEFLNLPFGYDGTPITSVFVRGHDLDSPRPLSYTITFESEPDLSKWVKPYSFGDYCDELSRQIGKLTVVMGSALHFETAQDENKRLRVSKFWIEFPMAAPALPLKGEIDRCSRTLRILHEKVEASLLPDASGNSVSVFFEFPPRVTTACEQYLLYFVEFLGDLGVEATSDLRKDAGRVLFTVTPKEPREALENIRVALEIYLQLPASPISNVDSRDSDVSTQKLLANINHLNEQLALSRAVIEANNVTIQAQQSELSQFSFNANVVIDSVVNVVPQGGQVEREEFLGGTLAVTKYQGKGFEINLPKIIRQLKQWFGTPIH